MRCGSAVGPIMVVEWAKGRSTSMLRPKSSVRDGISLSEGSMILKMAKEDIGNP